MGSGHSPRTLKSEKLPFVTRKPYLRVEHQRGTYCRQRICLIELEQQSWKRLYTRISQRGQLQHNAGRHTGIGIIRIDKNDTVK